MSEQLSGYQRSSEQESSDNYDDDSILYLFYEGMIYDHFNPTKMREQIRIIQQVFFPNNSE